MDMGQCCDISCNDYDGPEFVRDSIRLARVDHVCCECRETIPKGTKYEHVSGKWEGHINVFKTCLPCAGIRRDYCPTGWLYEGLRETIFACLGFDYVNGHLARWAEDEDEGA